KEVDRLKDEFVSVVSHELRTPLTSVRGSLGLALNSDEQLPDEVERLLEIAHQNTERLEMLVDDILDIEKIESGDLEFTPEPVAPGDLLDEVARSNESYAGEYGVELETHVRLDGEVIHVDRDRLFQILTNFVSNAIKYSPEGGTVTLNAQPVAEGESVRLSVSDRGEGIPEEFRDKLFERFTQADASTTRQRQGTGLGLSIAKALTEKMGGTIDFMTEIGEGTTFWVDFPVHRSSSAAERLSC
ncbi:MAG: sensor histidine kinase, partial [Bradymonadaceae bacterium]